MTGLAVATRTCTAHGPTTGEASPYHLHGFSSTPSAMRVGLSLDRARVRRRLCQVVVQIPPPLLSQSDSRQRTGEGRDGMG